MTSTVSSALRSVETVAELRPSYEGSNIGSWIGFKHINYMVEESLLNHFRASGFPAHALYQKYGLCVELVDISTRILTGFHLDDVVEATVRPAATGNDEELAFTVGLAIRHGPERTRAGSSKVHVLLRRDQPGWPAEAAPDELAPFTTSRIARAERDPAPIPGLPASHSAGRDTIDSDSVLAGLIRDTNSFGWHRRIPYFYSHFTGRMQMSGYMRQMEEIVDLFLADRGLSIKRLLDERSWIPVVPHSSVSMLAEAVMEEDLYTTFTVESIFKGFTYTSRMDAYVLRGGQLLRTATGRITHGYAEIMNRHDFRLVEFDERVLSALGGGNHAG